MIQKPHRKNIDVGIVIAIIGVIGVISAALIPEIGDFKIEKLHQAETQTSLTSIPTQTPVQTPTPTYTPTPTPVVCPYQGVTDDDTIRALIMAEAVAVRNKNMKIINDIFDHDAIFYDYTADPAKIWPGVDARYAKDLFIWVNFKDAEHFDVRPAGSGILGDVATYTSGSQITYQVNGGAWVEQTNGSSKTTQYGSEHWILKRNENGCWVITQMEFNAGHVRFP
jgi:hypothetical protein